MQKTFSCLSYGIILASYNYSFVFVVTNNKKKSDYRHRAFDWTILTSNDYFFSNATIFPGISLFSTSLNLLRIKSMPRSLEGDFLLNLLVDLGALLEVA